jgi:hypothetical protein
MAQAARKVTAKDANERAAHVRLTVLELAEATSPRPRLVPRASRAGA